MLPKRLYDNKQKTPIKFLVVNTDDLNTYL